MVKKVLFPWLFFWIIASSSAQSGDYIFKNYSTRDGLCDNNVNSITQDSRGFIWIGTREGLSRFDGAEFQNFYFDDAYGAVGSYSFLHNLDAKRLILLNNYTLSTLNTVTQKLQTVASFEKIKIMGIFRIDQGFALQTTDRILLINRKLQQTGEIKINGKIDSLLSVMELSPGKLLVGNCFDHYEYDLKSKKLSPFPINMRKYGDKIRSIFDLKHIDTVSQKIYIADYFSGLYVFDYNGKLLKRYATHAAEGYISSTNFISFLQDKQNNIWVATYGGINILKDNKTTVVQHHDQEDLSLKSNLVISFFADKNQNIWIATNEGISVYNNKTDIKIGKIKLADSQPVAINAIAFTSTEIYAGSYPNKIFKINANTKKINALKSKTAVWGLRNVKGNIIINGANPDTEVEIYNPKNNTLSQTNFLKKHYPETDIITLAFQHSNGDFWYSGNSGGGFVRKWANSDRTEHYYKDKNGKPLFFMSYYSLACEDANKNLWFGVNRSNLLLQWNYKTEKFREINFNDWAATRKTTFGGITGLKIINGSILWVSFEGGGIIKYNLANQNIVHYTIKKGLNSNFINAMELDGKNRLWLLTNKGISCLDTQTEKFFQLDIWDGFIEKPIDYNMLKWNPDDKKMWIGAVGGLYYFNPEELLQDKTATAKMYLDYVKVNNKLITLKPSKFHFQPNENNLEFRLVAVDIQNGKNLEYGYQLQGLDTAWHDTNIGRTANFQKLKAGNYIFNARVRTKGYKDWIYLPEPLVFSIEANWYETWWFYGLVSLAIIMILYVLVTYYLNRKLEKQQNELEKQKLVEEERKRIAKDMHDDLGSGLTKITYLSQMALQGKSENEYIANINKTSIELVENMSEIIWMMKDENNSWEELLLFVKKYAVDYCSDNGIAIHFEFPDTFVTFELSGEKRRHIYLSIKEILHNIIKHSKANKVILSVTQNDKTEITIKDNGIGISAASNPASIGGNGLKNIRERMKSIPGEFFIENNDGTTVRFIIPN